MILPDMPDVGLSRCARDAQACQTDPVSGRWKNIPRVMRIMPLSVADLLSEWFESDIVKAAIAAISTQ